MGNRETFTKILALFSADELKSLCKQWELKGYSKYNKAELVNFISVQTTEEAVPAFLKGDGTRKLEEIVGNATGMLGGAMIAGEKLGTLAVDQGRVDASFDGLKWKTDFSARLESIGDPAYEFSCNCKVADAGGLCIHYWAAMIHVIASGSISIEKLGPFVGLAGPAMAKSLKSAAVKPATPATIPDTSGKTIADLLQERTQGDRYHKALVELGLATPAEPTPKAKPKPKKASKTDVVSEEGAGAREVENTAAKKSPSKKDEVQRVDMWFIEKELGPPARLVTGLIKHEEGGTRESSIRVLIDEKQKLIAHEGCMDYQMRLAKQKLLCKHLIQVFASINEVTARRLLSQVESFRFNTELPRVKPVARQLDKAIIDSTPADTLADQDAMKGKIMDYLIEHEDDVNARSLQVLRQVFGDVVIVVLPVLVAEGIITESPPGRYAAK
jgi:hypothetical protein